MKTFSMAGTNVFGTFVPVVLSWNKSCVYASGGSG